MTRKGQVRLSAMDERKLSVAAECDPRTVRRALLGEHVQPTNLKRIANAIESLNLDIVLPKEKR